MLAAVYEGDRRIEVRDVPDPRAGPGEVVIDVSHCGICGTDLHFVMEGWAAPGTVHGHEYSGVVREVGDGVTGLSVGDRVVGGPGPGCGACRSCAAGHTQLCEARDPIGTTSVQGAFADRKALSAAQAFPLPDTLDLRTAALAEPVAVALRGVRRARPAPGSRVLVTGGGPIGLLTVAVLRASGVDDVTVSEPSAIRRERALAAGARAAVEPSALRPPAMATQLVDRPFDAAIECSGRVDAMEAALGQLGRAGVLVFSGTGLQPPRLEAMRVIINELVITGTFEYTRDDFTSAIELLASGRLPSSVLLEPDDVPLGGVGEAMRRLAAGEIAGKVLVSPRA